MTKKEIIEALNNLATKIDSVDETAYPRFTKFGSDEPLFEKKKYIPNYPEGIESFKAPFNGNIVIRQSMEYQKWCRLHLEREPISTIHSVQNSKGIVFTVGDEAKIGDSNSSNKIKSFRMNKAFINNPSLCIYATFDSGGIMIDSLTKDEKQQPSWKDQIIAFRGRNSGHIFLRNRLWVDSIGTIMNFDYLLEHEEIFTVKNSAGIEFSVGDEVSDRFSSFVIEKFESRGDVIVATGRGGSIIIDYANKVKPKEVLFTTQDGFGINQPQTLYYIDHLNDVVCFSFMVGDESWLSQYKVFKEKANAERFIDENEKSISYKELEDFLDKNYVGEGFLYEDIDSRRRFRTEILNKFKPQ